MKKSILLMAFLFPLMLIAQIKSSISGIMGIDYTNRVLNNPAFKDETGKLNYRVGANYNRKITEKIWLEMGLRAAFQGYNGLKLKNLTWASELNPTTGVFTRDPTLPHEVQLINNYLFLEMPIGIRYEFKQPKLKTYVAVGLSPNIYLTTHVKTITDLGSDNKFQQTEGINKVTFSANIGFGFDYALNDTYQAFAQPSFRYHFTSFSAGPIKEYLYNFGLELGIRKNLK
jgi:Outer membrane protein beta-barrel domain